MKERKKYQKKKEVRQELTGDKGEEGCREGDVEAGGGEIVGVENGVGKSSSKQSKVLDEVTMGSGGVY